MKRRISSLLVSLLLLLSLAACGEIQGTDSASMYVHSGVSNGLADLPVQGEEDGSFDFCIRTVYENVRETITNAMRYSGADRIDIIVKFLPDRLEVYIFDNGKGCVDIKENNGLSGIRSRTEAAGGTVRFSSVEGEGFSTVIKIPKGTENSHDKSNNS